MSKITLNDVASLRNTTTAQNTINDNWDTITTGFDNTLSRDGSSPNSMSAALDMNSQHILNLPAPIASTEPLRVLDAASLTAGGSITVNTISLGVTVTSFGAVGDGVHDDTSAIQNAIDSLPATGGIVYFPVGTYRITDTIVIGDGPTDGSAESTKQGIVLKGLGNSTNNSGNETPTRTAGLPKIKWDGAVNGTMLYVSGPLSGWGVHELCFDGNLKAYYGMQLWAAQYGHCRGLSFIRINSGIFCFGGNTGGVGSLDANTMHNVFENISVVPENNNGEVGAFGIVLDGLFYNSCFNTFNNVFIGPNVNNLAGSIFGVYFKSCDGNYFHGLHCTTSVIYDYTNNPGWPAGNIIVGCDVTSWGIAGSPDATATPNYIMGLSETNGNHNPNLENTFIVDPRYKRIPKLKTTDYTVVLEDMDLIFNGSGSITVTLPSASTFAGRELTMKTVAAQTVVSASSNVKPLNSSTAGTAILAATAGKWARLLADGTNWVIMEAN